MLCGERVCTASLRNVKSYTVPGHPEPYADLFVHDQSTHSDGPKRFVAVDGWLSGDAEKTYCEYCQIAGPGN